MASVWYSLGMALAAVIGVIFANYIGDTTASINSGPWISVISGAILFGIAVYLIPSYADRHPRGDALVTAIKLLLEVSGVTLVLRGVFGNGTAGSGLLNLTMPPEVSQVV